MPLTSAAAALVPGLNKSCIAPLLSTFEIILADDRGKSLHLILFFSQQMKKGARFTKLLSRREIPHALYLIYVHIFVASLLQVIDTL